MFSFVTPFFSWKHEKMGYCKIYNHIKVAELPQYFCRKTTTFNKKDNKNNINSDNDNNEWVEK